jgi:hypothetical protein
MPCDLRFSCPEGDRSCPLSTSGSRCHADPARTEGSVPVAVNAVGAPVLGDRGPARWPGMPGRCARRANSRLLIGLVVDLRVGDVALGQVVRDLGTYRDPARQFSRSRPEAHAGR